MYEVCLPPEDSVLDGGEEKSEEGVDGIKKRGVGAMVKIFHFVMKQSYICALIAMMVSDAAHRCCYRATETHATCLDVRTENTSKSNAFIKYKLTVNKLLQK